MKALNHAIDRFCRQHPRFGIPNLMLYVVICNVVVYVMDLVSSGTFSAILSFSRAAILQGEVWRIITFVLMPGSSGNLIFFALQLYFYYFIGSQLERQWGSTKFTIFYLCGIVLNIIFGMIAGGASMYYVNMSMFFAFATLYPDLRFLLFFIIPVKAKWLAIADVVFFLYAMISTTFPYNLLPMVAILNYLIFFAEDFLELFNIHLSEPKTKHDRNTASFKKAAKKIQHEKGYLHKCAVCGRTDTDHPELEFRYCSKCNGYYCYCMDHINNHVHIQ